MIAAALAATISIVISTSFAIFDPDLFQHLLVGKVIWQTHGVPQHHLWTWPSYGQFQVLPSWLFRALLWPFWSIGGVWGLFAWRWSTTLAAFGVAWATARRLGARGLAPLAVIALCALVYRQRSMPRPETLVAVLLALELWILETRRQGGPDRSAWLIGIAWVWANAHLSYYLGLAVLGVFWLDARLAASPARARLGVILAMCGAVSFLNPFGWRALWQPFEYFLYWRHEPIFQVIGELEPITWAVNVENGLPLLMLGWPALFLWRAARGRFDRVEAVLGLAFTGLTLFGQRFLGSYAVIAAAYVSRDLADAIGSTGIAARMPAWGRAGLVALASLGVGLREWSAPDMPLGIRLRPLWYPERACDFMAEHGVRGRGFNHFDLAGYQLYRFWPDRERLPFIDIHQTAARADRDAYARLLSEPSPWTGLDARHHFDYALLSRRVLQPNGALDALDADSSFALVFLDDVAALYVRRAGPLSPVAARFGYRLLPAGSARIGDLQRRCAADSIVCRDLEAELGRAIAGSPRDSQARSLLASVALSTGRTAEARAQLQAALAVDPSTLRAHERLGILALRDDDPRGALEEFQAELRRNGPLPGLWLRMGEAQHRLGDTAAAARDFRRELSRHPENQAAADSLAALPKR
jgi:tetratricopeptide (TPR) repeat protein